MQGWTPIDAFGWGLHMKATKDDKGKLPYHLMPADAVEEVVRVLQFGAEKYGERNWERGLDHSRCYAAIHRHAAAYWQGQDVDEDSGLLHTAHIATNGLFLLSHQLRGIGVDDRP